jgi:hypothetical protein
VVLIPDPRGRLAGRGAHVHPDPRCLDLAERRRAFGRALRVDGPVDLTQVRAYLVERTGVPTTSRTDEPEETT